MTDNKYIINKEQVSTLLGRIQSKSIAIPEIQRPFVWPTTKVRDLIDSLYHSYPIGYIITWKSPKARLKNANAVQDTTPSIIIDGQQRITALQAALHGEPVLDENYKKRTIKIAFNPVTGKFKTCTPAVEKNPQWIPNIAVLFNGQTSPFTFCNQYKERNAGKNLNEKTVEENIEQLLSIKQREIGTIELTDQCDIQVVTKIFTRINQNGVRLDQHDFVMSKIAANEAYDGVNIRKTIDYFCHLIQKPGDLEELRADAEFSDTPAFGLLSWAAKKPITIYTPSYTDVIRVAFTHKFHRGKLNDLVQLLSGRDFENRTWDEEIAQNSFSLFKDGVHNVINKTNFERFTMILTSIGFIDKKLMPASGPVNFAYALYLYLKSLTGEEAMEEAMVEKYVRRWLVMSILTKRYSTSLETRIDEDIRNIKQNGIKASLQKAELRLDDKNWNVLLPNDLEKSKATHPFAKLYWAVLCKDKTRGFLSQHKTVDDMIRMHGDVHHIYPKKYLARHNYKEHQYNRLANYIYLEQPFNIKIGDGAPQEYLGEVIANLGTDAMSKSSITSMEDLKRNLAECDIPEMVLNGTADNYNDFIQARSKLMAAHIKRYWDNL